MAVACSTNEKVERIEYVVYGSISAPIRNSPRSVCETYTCRFAETTILCSIGLTGSVTYACSAWFVIGVRMPAMSVICVVQPATAQMTTPASIGPLLVSTPMQLAVRVLADARDLHALVDVRAALGRAGGVAPDHGVVAQHGARRVVERRLDGVRHVVATG